jgi:hypothetical protein
LLEERKKLAKRRPAKLHTLKIIASGIVMLGVFLLAGRYLGETRSAGIVAAAKYFIPAWLIAAAVNMWFGVSQAGYNVHDEAPIFLLNFAIPAAIAALIWWRA